MIDDRGNASSVGVGEVVASDAIVVPETSKIRFKARTLLAVYYLRQV